MTYASLLEAYGWERFERDARAAGADEPDRRRPAGRRARRSSAASSSSRRPRPTSGSRSRPRETDGWLYLVTVTGTTGARGDLSPALAGLVERARASPTCRSTPASGSRRRSTRAPRRELADGVVVGTRAVEVAEEGPDALRDYVASLRAAIDAAVAA